MRGLPFDTVARPLPLLWVWIWMLGASNGFLAQENPCLLDPDPGPCEAAIPAWYFDQETGGCSMFFWGGCDGVVPFETLEDCAMAACDGDSTLSNLCDSIAVVPLVIGDNFGGHLEVEVSPAYSTPYWFSYAGFALFDQDEVLLAAENVATAPNSFGFDGNVPPHSRYLDYAPGINLSLLVAPFNLELRLYEGWMAGGSIERCRWDWTSFDSPSSVILPALHSPFVPSETFDLLGRPASAERGRLMIQRDQKGRSRKVVISE